MAFPIIGFLMVMIFAGRLDAAEPVELTPSPRIDLSDKVDWCESDPDLDVADIPSDACRLVPATSQSLERGYSDRAFWLRLSLTNPGPEDEERLLVLGHSRLQRVSFFESVSAGGWRRREAGTATAPATRPALSTDPALPIKLAAGETRTVLVRVASQSSINLSPTLWDPKTYAGEHRRVEFLQAVAIGGLLMAAIFPLMIYLQWKDRAYLYFSASQFTKAIFDSCFTGLLPTYILPADQAFDIRVQTGWLGAALSFFILFVRQFVGSRQRYPNWDRLLLMMLAAVVVATAWSGTGINHGMAIRLLAILALAIMVNAAVLFWLGWRDRLPASGYLLFAYSSAVLILAHRIFDAFMGGSGSRELSLGYSWEYLLTLPTGLIGLAVHKDIMVYSLESARAESASQVEFLARMSHELRTPLDAILGNAQLLSRSSNQSLLTEGLAIIRESGWHLLRMIDDILDHTRCIAGKLSLTPRTVNPHTFLHGVVQNAKILAARNGNQVSLRMIGANRHGVLLDENRVRQVLDNLLVNAARHTKNGWIRLDCRIGGERAGNKLRLDFAVTDSGEGIPLSDQERIFRPFERGGGTAGNGGKGAGMGLAISRQLVEMMGGTLTVESRPGEGACFSFYIFAEPADLDAVEPSPTAGSALSNYRGTRRTVLLIDDEDANRHVLARLLHDHGFAVVEARSGQAAVDLCRSFTKADIVLTDQFMANGDGWMVLRTLSELLPEAPVLLMSAAPAARPEDFPQGLDFTRHLLKPIDHEVLLRHIGDLLDLEWEEPPEETGESPATEIPDEYPPNETDMEILRAMIEAGQVSDIMTWAARLKIREPRCAIFADRVHTAARQLDFPALNKLAGPLNVRGREMRVKH
ncbi:hybrid sensor histidine kinase/response regulator [Telmatospirillum siberiense]|uniref:hybrid sensor histidine kinase/response regulator n=1 Tax=Telmatospirillum siberiense TaxID=382514 RepID=UPI00130411BB|nr:hybrid sensor histidine kinase/response regulator [Telmatospirillum siberiense]